MIYLIKFLYQWLLPPACFFLLLLGLDVYMYKKKLSGRLFLSFVLIVFYFLSIRVGANILIQPLENWYVPPDTIDSDVLLMLGNGSVAGVPDIDGVGQPAGTMAKSMLTTVRLYHKTGLPILVSGGIVYQDTGSEADIALRTFSAMGVPNNLLYEESKSRTTVENAKYSHEICNMHGWKHPLLLVVALQAPRTAMVFQREGLDCTIYPTHYRMARGWHFHPVLDLIPDSSNLNDSASAIKEYMGILVYKFKIK
jgi:uncharacterized SAM-binding protein YcdF (DUF218 family)